LINRSKNAILLVKISPYIATFTKWNLKRPLH